MKRCRCLRFPLGALVWLIAASTPPALRADPAAAPTPTPWYRVELVVFARLAPDAGSHETWPSDPGVPDLADAVALVPAPGSAAPGSGDGAVVTPLGPVPYQELSAVTPAMAGVVNTLNGSHRYRVLLQLAWRQPTYGRQSARPVRVQLPDGVLEGTVLLRHSRYLHVALDLLYRPGGGPVGAPAAPGDTGAGAGSGSATGAGTGTGTDTGTTSAYRMRQHRRIDPGVLNYFDHPLFGVLIKATSIDVEPAAAPSDTTGTPGGVPAPAPAAPPGAS